MAFPLDSGAASLVTGWDVPGDLDKAVQLSEAFAHGSGAAAILGCILLVVRQRRGAVWAAILLTATSGLVANGLKSCVVRVRPHSVGQLTVGDTATQLSTSADPDSLDPPPIVAASFWDSRQRSFPSGHAATAWALAIGLSLLFPRGTVAFAALAVLASLQRVLSGAHYPSDVLAGAAVAFVIAALLLTHPTFRRQFPTAHQPGRPQ